MANTKVALAIVLCLLAMWTKTIHASNAMLSNLKSFTAGGVGGKIRNSIFVTCLRRMEI
jgi:hypothetical protein